MNIEQIKHRICNIAIMCDENDKEQLDILVELLALINDINIESIETVKDVPSEENTAEWIDREIYDADRWKCSKCGKTEQYREKYCPNCGCKMKGESDGKTEIKS